MKYTRLKSCVLHDVNRSNIAKWFGRFYREDTVRNHDRGDGYGIGLSIAKAVVTDMGGSIDATLSRDGHTLSMTVRIPLAREDRPQRHLPWETVDATPRRHGTKARDAEQRRHHRNERGKQDGAPDSTKGDTQHANTSDTDSGNAGDAGSNTQDADSAIGRTADESARADVKESAEG